MHPNTPARIIIETQGLSLWYGAHQALFGVTLAIPRHRITAIIGPSGCGKSSLLRCFNRMNDLIRRSATTAPSASPTRTSWDRA